VSGSVAFLIGTLLTWLGWSALLRAAYLGLKAVLGIEAHLRSARVRGAGTACAVAAVCLVAAASFHLTPSKGPSLPLVWVLMPFTGWLVVASLAFAAGRACQAWTALTLEERRRRLGAVVVWMAVAAGSWWLFRATDGDAQVFRGSIPVTWTVAGSLIALALATVFCFVLVGRATRARGWTKAAAAHAALIAGSIVFVIPFVWLVVTSFKEDRDMSSVNGIVWIPRRQVTEPYYDPADPLYEADYKGRDVQGSVEETLPNGRVMLEISRPFSLTGIKIEADRGKLKRIPKDAPVDTATFEGRKVTALEAENLSDGRVKLHILEPKELHGTEFTVLPGDTDPVMVTGLRTRNYSDALDFLPPQANMGLTYLRNTLILVVMTLIGTIMSSAFVGYGFSRLRFPGKNGLFAVLLSTMMLPGAVTMLPSFLIFRQLGWIDTLYPLWVPSFFASAFNVFLLRQFFLNIPMELEDAAKIDGCSYMRTFWQVMLPQIKPAIAVIAIWTFMGSWNNFMGPLIYISSPEHMPIAYALQLFQTDRGSEPGLTMAFATMSTVPVVLLFFFAQKYFIEGVQLTGLGGR
jgi:multiple sugar transport system permease protein